MEHASRFPDSDLKHSRSFARPAAPCVPRGVAAAMECSNDTGLVSWDHGHGVSSYLVSAVGPDGHVAQCDSTAASCQLQPVLHCGQRYNLTLTAQDGQCDNSRAHLALQSGNDPR